MRFSKDIGKRYDECRKNGYEVHLEKNFYPLGENKPNLLELKDTLNRTAIINEFDNNGKDEIGIRLFNTNITLDQAETLIKELQDGINFAEYLKENL
jgi:hypothetical protein